VGGAQPGRGPWAGEDSSRAVLRGGALRAGAWGSGQDRAGKSARALGASTGAKMAKKRWTSILHFATV